jgi:hypothetical protein
MVNPTTAACVCARVVRCVLAAPELRNFCISGFMVALSTFESFGAPKIQTLVTPNIVTIFAARAAQSGDAAVEETAAEPLSLRIAGGNRWREIAKAEAEALTARLRELFPSLVRNDINSSRG